jgi:Tfp pilus assembly protein PilF
MNKRYPLEIIFTTLFVLISSGCQNPQHEAQRALAEEMAKRQEQQNESTQCYQKALEAWQAEDEEQARQYLRKAVNHDERNARAWMALGTIEFQRNKLFEAAHAFQRAARLEPNRYEPNYNIALVLESAGYYRKAVESYEKALQLSPDQLEVMENLARCYLKIRQNTDAARDLIDRALVFEQRPEWQGWLEEQKLFLEQKGEN